MATPKTVNNPGYRTSEFWMAVVGILIPILNQVLKLEIPEEAIYTIVAYIIGRSGVKAVNVRRK